MAIFVAQIKNLTACTCVFLENAFFFDIFFVF